LSPFVALALFCLPAVAQTQFSGQITSNVVGASATLANPVNYNETFTAVGVSTTGALSCAAYPQITFFFTRAGVEQTLGFVTTSGGSSWTGTNEIPLTASFTAQSKFAGFSLEYNIRLRFSKPLASNSRSK
jgi:hypothetical protein